MYRVVEDRREIKQAKDKNRENPDVIKYFGDDIDLNKLCEREEQQSEISSPKRWRMTHESDNEDE